jgi:hypothetical protein
MNLKKVKCEKREGCHWTPAAKTPDTGKPGKTPESEKWGQGIKIEEHGFEKYFPGGKVNMTAEACQTAGNNMQEAGISKRSAVSKLNWLANKSPYFSDKERRQCQEGLDKAYSK